MNGGELMKFLISVGLLCAAVCLGGCRVGFDPKTCTNMPEAKGEDVARTRLKGFLQYVGQTRSPLSGPGGTLDSARLEYVSDDELVYDGRSPGSANAYEFHLSWAPQVKFTTTVSADCSATSNWSIG